MGARDPRRSYKPDFVGPHSSADWQAEKEKERERDSS